MRLLAIILVTVAVATPAIAAKMKATPETLPAVLQRAGDGDEIVLSAATFPPLRLRLRTFAIPLVIDARQATITGWYFAGVEGVTIRGGTWQGDNPLRIDLGRRIKLIDAPSFSNTPADPEASAKGYGVRIVKGGDIEINGASFKAFRAGITADGVDGLTVKDSTFARMSADGMNLRSVHHVMISGNLFHDTIVGPGAHADAIQFDKPLDATDQSLWSSDIVVEDNEIEGPQQGVFGGFIRGAQIRRNRIKISFANAIGFLEAHDLVLEDNKISTYPGGRDQARINLRNPEGLTRRRNTVEAFGSRPGATD